jgi:hypothetical protein
MNIDLRDGVSPPLPGALRSSQLGERDPKGSRQGGSTGGCPAHRSTRSFPQISYLPLRVAIPNLKGTTE